LPPEVNADILSGKLTVSQGKKLLQLKDIMTKSPKDFVDSYMVHLAHDCIKNNWSLEQLSDILDNIKFNYIRNRETLYDMNTTHEENIAKSGYCFCIDLRKEAYRRQGLSEELIKQNIEGTKDWGKEDHVHILCCEDLASKNYLVYYSVMNLYGIHHSDIEKLKPTLEELEWIILKNIKWTTNDKGLCWSCSEKPAIVPMNGVLYCPECAHAIIDERAADAMKGKRMSQNNLAP
jgi:hypothetical protein